MLVQADLAAELSRRQITPERAAKEMGIPVSVLLSWMRCESEPCGIAEEYELHSWLNYPVERDMGKPYGEFQ